MDGKATMTEKLLTAKEAVAAGYGSQSTLYRYRKSGKLPAIKKLGKYYFKQSDLEALSEKYAVSENDLYEQYAQKLMADMPEFSLKTKQKIADLVMAYMPN